MGSLRNLVKELFRGVGAPLKDLQGFREFGDLGI